MTEGVKPYRLYRGGRSKGKVPLDRRFRSDRTPPVAAGDPRRRRRWGLWVALALVGLIVLVIVWGVLGYVSFSRGVSKANERLPPGTRAKLAPQDGSLLSTPSTILVMGTDGGSEPGRGSDHRSDSLLLLHTDPGTHRISYLSIPRDLRVDIPGYGPSKINAASQLGGPTLTLSTVRALTGLPIQHVVVVDFDGFKKLIDAIGGIEVNVPKPILSNRFDCPYPTRARCLQWKGWRFHRGPQHMNGEQALIYSRIRENQLNPGENDLTRAARQQAVAQAAEAKLASVGTLFSMPFDGNKLMKPLATDLSTWQLMELGWVKFRASGSHTLYCRLGGDATSVGGSSVLLPSEDNRSVLAMWAGLSAPQPPTTTFGPGCRVGHPLK